MNDNSLPFPILIGDIGGTNARFSVLLNALDAPVDLPTAQTASYLNIDDAIRDCVFEKAGLKPKSAILAIAGPVDGDEVDLTNCPWVVRPKVLMRDLGFEAFLLVNDFEAQALAIASMGEEHRELLGGPNAMPDASRVVLGPGTGLGVGGLFYLQGLWVPVPGEGGHMDIGPRTPRDYQLFPHYTPIEGRISGEQLLCGRGLVNIYNGVCAADGIEPVLKTPADITANGLPGGSNEQARETLTLFATYLGRVAGDVALVFKADGGVFLAGGISQRIIPVLKMPEFRAAFEDKAPHTQMLRDIPTYVVTHPMAALAGLADYARAPGRFGLSTQGRYWRA